MNANTILNKMYPLSNINQVLLRAQHDNHLTIVQGDQEALTILAPADVLSRIKVHVRGRSLEIGMGGDWKERLRDALTTSLTRPQISYVLRVRRLTDLEVFAMATISMERMQTKRLSIRFNGLGLLEVKDLGAEKLEVELSGASRVEIAGIVTEQSLSLKGLAQYEARRLKSRRTYIEMSGTGAAAVWAVERLDVDVRGPGSVAYYGAPQVNKKLTPMGSLTHLGNAKASA